MTRYERFLFSLLLSYVLLDSKTRMSNMLPNVIKSKISNDEISILWLIIFTIIFYFLIGYLSPIFDTVITTLDNLVSNLGLSNIFSSVVVV